MHRRALEHDQPDTFGCLPEHADHGPTRAALAALAAAGVPLVLLTHELNDKAMHGAFAWPSIHNDGRATDVRFFITGDMDEQPTRNRLHREGVRTARNTALGHCAGVLCDAGFSVSLTVSRSTSTPRVQYLTAYEPTPGKQQGQDEHRTELAAVIALPRARPATN